jgi:D-alanyl-D-alanine carboxypeptidase (penicillin-binding protein 5/6)
VRARLLVACLAALALVPAAHAAVPYVDARAYFIQDASTGEVLAERDADVQMPIASITKLMTVIVALQRHVPLSEIVTVQRAAAEVGESTIHLRAGERISVVDLLKAALIQSANDAADALADQFGPGAAAFVARMNATAREDGLLRTHFARPDGLDAPGHVSTARDVTRLAQIAMRTPVVRAIVRQRTARISGGRTLQTWNDLLGLFRGLDGVKTGHTGGAGWCEVAEVKRDGLDVYATILGSPTRSQRNQDLAALLRWALSVERPAWVIAPDRVYVRVSAGYGRAAIPLVAARGIVRPVRIDRPLVERVVAPDAVSLPVQRGARLGEVRVFDGRRLVARQPLIAARGGSAPGALGRVGFYARRTLSHIGNWFT